MPPRCPVRRAREVGIGAVKYADLSTSRTRDYIFDVDRMVADGKAFNYSTIPSHIFQKSWVPSYCQA